MQSLLVFLGVDFYFLHPVYTEGNSSCAQEYFLKPVMVGFEHKLTSSY